jgi:hypothetical protein
LAGGVGRKKHGLGPQTVGVGSVSFEDESGSARARRQRVLDLGLQPGDR